MRYLFFLIGVGITAGCAPGLNSTVCVVDPPRGGFQCSTDLKPSGYYLSWEEGKDLICASSSDTEDFLKACKQQQILPITLCSYQAIPPGFLCTAPPSPTGTGEKVTITLDQANNYFCLSPKDHKRVLQRCALN